MANLLAQATREVLREVGGVLPLLYVNGLPIDGLQTQQTARGMGLELYRLDVSPLTGARLLFGAHPERALSLLCQAEGVGPMEALRLIGTRHPGVWERRLVANGAERARAHRARAAEGNPEAIEQWTPRGFVASGKLTRGW